ncbi:MAG: hypothetical protein ACD_11C00020G0025 [uncultured bacterium]|nr:MAG: hypothetical protein ACD_11C00020G0025 [uncultured bacterium]HBR71310.1 hypothetical protein [Candidatus Moranbacteria bacterium]
MQKNKKIKINFLLTGTAIVMMMVFLARVDFFVEADEDMSVDDAKEKIAELEKKAQAYREIIELKQKQQASLNNQISLMDVNISQVETEIEINKNKIEELNALIERKELEIRDKEETILSQKKLLGGLLKNYYEQQQKNILSVFLTDNVLAPFMSEKDRLAQIGNKIQEIINGVKSLKEQLENEKGDLKKDKEDVSILHADLQNRNENLQYSKDNKEVLLAKTQGEEEKYKKLLERVEKQKLELLNFDELYSESYSINGMSVNEYIEKNKPSSSLNSSLSWYYSQKDSSWANTKIGNSKSLMKDYGCAVASVAMAFTKQGDTITPKSLTQKPIFSWDLIAWPSTSMPSGKVDMDESGSYHGNISFSKIDSEIKNGTPVIVYIKKSSGGGHYVVIHTKDKKKNDYVVHDPYFGPNLYLSTSRALVGNGGSTTMDQMIIYN